MTAIIVLGVLGLAAAVALLRGPHVALAWVYFPVFFLVPASLLLALPVVPDLTPRSAAAIGVLCGGLLAHPAAMRLPKACYVDALVAAVVVSYSISYGLQTDFMGLVHALAARSLEWALPYALVRVLWQDIQSARAALVPVGSSVAALGLACVYECRMAHRILAEVWDVVAGLGVPRYHEAWRWGYLRAVGTFSHPLTLGTVLASMAPLMLLWAKLSRRWRIIAWGAAGVCVCGTVATLSRGPMAAVLLGLAVAFMAAERRPVTYALLAVAAVALIPVALDALGEGADYVRRSFAEHGNVESGYYRLALIILYLGDLTRVGFFGDLSLVGQEYELAYSVDNSYLYLFFYGGWIGGGLFLTMIGGVVVSVVRSLRRSSSRAIRTARALVLGSCIAMLASMADVYFAPDYASLLFVIEALAISQTRESWYASRSGGSALPRRELAIPATRIPAFRIPAFRQVAAGPEPQPAGAVPASTRNAALVPGGLARREPTQPPHPNAPAAGAGRSRSARPIVRAELQSAPSSSSRARS